MPANYSDNSRYYERLNQLKQDLLPQTEEWRKELTEKTNNFNYFKQNKYANKKKDYDLAQNRLQLLLSEEERHKTTLNEMLNDYENKQNDLNIKQEKFHEIDQQLIQTEQFYQEKHHLLKHIEDEYTNIDKRFKQNQLELNNIQIQMQTTQTRDRTLNFLLEQKQQEVKFLEERKLFTKRLCFSVYISSILYQNDRGR